MIVGNGLLARAFNRYKDDDNIIIFASGVSNSSLSSESEFCREVELLEKNIIDGKKLIYFSTCSIYDTSINSSPYVLHKLNIENIIKTKCKNYIIFRLPIVISDSDNNNTFFNNIKNKILNGDDITIYKNATRYLIDIDDISSYLPYFIDSSNNKTINVCFDNKMYVSDIINIMCEILSKNIYIIYNNLGSNYDVDNSEFKKSNIFFDKKEYNKKILHKYL